MNEALSKAKEALEAIAAIENKMFGPDWEEIEQARSIALSALSALSQEAGPVAYGCHCDLEPHMQPDGCVIDTGRRQDCVYAGRHESKEQCEYWQPIAITHPQPQQDARDAERYRLLRDRLSSEEVAGLFALRDVDEMERFIDAALAAGKEKQ